MVGGRAANKEGPQDDGVEKFKFDLIFFYSFNSGNLQVLPSGALVIESVRLSDRAEYRCVVSMGGGGDSRSSRAARLKIDPGAYHSLWF